MCSFLSTLGILLCFLMTLAISVMTPNLKNIISGESPRFRIKVSSPGSVSTCSTRHLDTLCVCHHFKIQSIGVSWTALVNLGDKSPGKPTHSWVFLCFLSLPCPGLAARRYSRLGSPLLRVSFQYTCMYPLGSQLITAESPTRFLNFGNLTFLPPFEILKNLSKWFMV